MPVEAVIDAHVVVEGDDRDALCRSGVAQGGAECSKLCVRRWSQDLAVVTDGQENRLLKRFHNERMHRPDKGVCRIRTIVGKPAERPGHFECCEDGFDVVKVQLRFGVDLLESADSFEYSDELILCLLDFLSPKKVSGDIKEVCHEWSARLPGSARAQYYHNATHRLRTP